MQVAIGPSGVALTERPRTRWRLAAVVALSAVLGIGMAVRLTVFTWQDPFGPHHPDEAILPLESLALWEGVTPREVGWPASTTRIALSAAHAVQWLSSQPTPLATAQEPVRVMASMAQWVGARYSDPAPLYRLDRAMMVAIGTLQLAALAWALKQWLGPAATIVGTLAVAIAPLPVAYSQYVLADMTGVLFATLIAGLASRPNAERVMTMGALSGLAAASKFHFGIWLLAPVCCIWLDRGMPFANRWRLTLATVAAAFAVIVMLVPWVWLNPFLAAKEFAGVVLVKVASGGHLPPILANIWTLLDGLGAIVLAGAAVGLIAVASAPARSTVPLLVPSVLAICALAASGIVFDRYGLVVLPGLAVIAGIGWETALLHRQRFVRAAALVALLVSLGVTVGALIDTQRTASEVDVDVLTRNWIMANVERGKRIARYDEDSTPLPRTPEQLRACVDAPTTSAAYVEKLRLVGMSGDGADAEPMRSAVLNDELFRAHWCRRELGSQRDSGFYITPYHSEPRFGAVLERDALADFRSGSKDATGGVDVLVMNRLVDVGVQPAAVFRTRRGQRVVYSR